MLLNRLVRTGRAKHLIMVIVSIDANNLTKYDLNAHFIRCITVHDPYQHHFFILEKMLRHSHLPSKSSEDNSVVAVN
jgi:hypothetical protein